MRSHRAQGAPSLRFAALREGLRLSHGRHVLVKLKSSGDVLSVPLMKGLSIFREIQCNDHSRELVYNESVLLLFYVL